MPQDTRESLGVVTVFVAPLVLLLVDAAAWALITPDSGLPALISAVSLVIIAPVYLAFQAIRSSSAFTRRIALAAASLLLCWAIVYGMWGLWSGNLLQPDDETVILMMGEMAAAIIIFTGATFIFRLQRGF